LLLGALAACSHAPAVAPAAGPIAELVDVAPFFVPGEQITWQVEVLGLEGGRARMSVGAAAELDGRRVVAAVLEVESSELMAMVKSYKETVASWVDVASGLPVRTEGQTVIDGKALGIRTAWQGERAELRLRHDGGAEETRAQPLPSRATHDAISVILLLRAWKAASGARGRYYILDGQRLWRNDLVIEGSETIDVPLGRRRAVRLSGSSTALTASLAVDPATTPRRFSYWFSDDDERIPLRLVSTTAFGELDMRATSYVGATGLRSSAAIHSPPTMIGN
jgi:hypothetical protein